MHLLVRSARKNHSADADWAVNGAGLNVNHKYGFGAVNAAAALALADQWPSVGGEISVAANSGAISLPIPENPGGPVSSSLNVAGAVLKVESVEIDVHILHPFRGDLRIALIAPSGTRSLLTERTFDGNSDFADDGGAWTFTSRRHWGESSSGTWTLEVQDLADRDTGTLLSWGVRVYGSVVDATPPTAGTVNEGAGADIDGQTGTTSVQANWSGFVDPQSGLVYELGLGTSPGATDVVPFTPAGSGTSGTLTGLSLTQGTRYYVAVRARNFDGLTTVVSGDGVVPDAQAPNAPAAPAATPARSSSGVFALSWSAPSDSRGVSLDSWPR